MVYSAQLEQLGLDIFGNSELLLIAVLALFAYLCFKRNFGFSEYMFVLLPVIIGIGTSNDQLLWVRGLFVIVVGIVWGWAILKTLNVTDTAIRVTIIFLCAQYALVLIQYETVPLAAAETNVTQLNTDASSSWTTFIISAISSIPGYITTPLYYLTGGGIAAVITSIGLPDVYTYIIIIPIRIIGFFATIGLIKPITDIIIGALGVLKFW